LNTTSPSSFLPSASSASMGASASSKAAASLSACSAEPEQVALRHQEHRGGGHERRDGADDAAAIALHEVGESAGGLGDLFGQPLGLHVALEDAIGLGALLLARVVLALLELGLELFLLGGLLRLLGREALAWRQWAFGVDAKGQARGAGATGLGLTRVFVAVDRTGRRIGLIGLEIVLFAHAARHHRVKSARWRGARKSARIYPQGLPSQRWLAPPPGCDIEPQ
jgi:hypothetical protein